MRELDPRRASTFGARAEDYERWRPSYPPEAVREVDGPSLRGRLRTHSAFAVLPPDERERLIEAMVAVVTAEARRRGTPTVPLRRSAHCARWRPG